MKKIIYYIFSILVGRKKMLSIFARGAERNLLGFAQQGYLFNIGWTRSVSGGQIVDAQNKPIPWVTYPFFSFIAGRLRPDFTIFEFGCGNSTLYYSDNVAHVDAVEHDGEWYHKIKALLPANASLTLCALQPGGEYSQSAACNGKKYDVIMVDGRDRVNCCKNSISALNAGGVLVLDDAERQRYREGIDFLLSSGFKKIDFWGLAPAIDYQKCTTIFYRMDNCLDI